MDGTNVVYIQRKPNPNQISIERCFDQVRNSLPKDIKHQTFICPCRSVGLLPRLKNMASVRLVASGNICHVTGDIHFVTLSLPSSRTILTVHDAGVLLRLKGWRREIVRKLWFEWPVRHAAVVTTVSHASKKELISLIAPSLHPKVQVVYNALCPGFYPVPKPFNSVRPAFLQVGTGYNKNLNRVIEALQGISCTLEIVGLLKEEQKSLLMRSGLEYIAHGKVSDEQLTNIYKNVDALIFASTIEGFGLPIIEAQATGRPVITSNRSSMPEVAGEGALLVDPEDVSSISSAIRNLISNAPLRASLVQKGFENLKRFQPSEVASKYADIYRELAHGQK